MIIQTYYISTGRKNAMYTLRCRRDAVGQAPYMADFMPDFYVCTLAADDTRAAEKATTYVDAMRERIGDTDSFKIVFYAGPEREAYKRRGKLSVQDTHKLERIEAGVLPFGKHAGKRIDEAPDSYILYFADKTREQQDDYVVSALAAACMGVALEKGLIAKREQVRAERAVVDALSAFVGTIGERRDFTGQVITSFEKGDESGFSYWINKVRCGDDIVTYTGGKSLGEQGSAITFRATVKRHEECNGVRSTRVSRPA